jgi:hypothetical protein
MRVATRNDGDQPAEHAHAADRCARTIVGILTVSVVRLRRLMGRPLGGWGSVVARTFSDVHARCVSARCAGVVRRLVVLLARCGQQDRVLGVVPPNARRAGVIACPCGAVMPSAGERA